MGRYSFNSSAGLEMGQLENFSRELAYLLEDLPEMKRELHQELADEMKRALDVRIDSAMDDSLGHVKSWQVPQVGSGGGYAAVRPMRGQLGKTSYGALTTYLERGHKARRPSETAKKAGTYSSRRRFGYINGRWFYRNTYITFERHAIRRAEKFVNQIADRLEGSK